MDNPFNYRKKNVHDIKVGNSFVRLWNQNGTTNSKMIIKAFQPLLKTSFVYPYVALMPDFHPCEGSMVGSVIPTRNILLPTVIGNDIGCGMTAVRIPVLSDNFTPYMESLRQLLRKKIPTGSTYNSIITKRVCENPALNEKDAVSFISRKNWKKLIRQFGSLGGGNHFLEIQTDEEGYVWVMLHSGSRYLGVLVREYYVNAGKNQTNINRQLYSKIPYLIDGSEIAANYLKDLKYSVDFAKESRKEMMLRVLEIFSLLIPAVKDTARGISLIKNAIDIAHNYISKEEYLGQQLYIHRKGAIRVKKGEKGIVPGSMGTSSYIVEGKGNEFSFCTCSHGAGRVMSRGDAFRRITNKDFKDSMRGIIFENNMDIKDEAPQAYKDINTVIRGQKDIIKILYKLKPLISIKGD